MKIAFQRFALLFLITLFIIYSLSVPAFGRETQTYLDPAENITDDDLPQTGDGLLIKLKFTGLTVITSAGMLLLLNYRKRI